MLATNVAETSLTVPGIHYVVDPGFARISRYSARLKVQRLPIEPVSQASADQRKGRCGRTSDGIAIRLYSEEDFTERPRFTDPEILRTVLAAVILQMAAIDLGDVEDFPFLDPPDRRQVRDGIALLQELGALDESGRKLTPLGRQLAQLPIDPRMGRMVIEAERLGCVEEVIVIASALSIQDVRERPADQQAQADQAHARHADESSDFLALLEPLALPARAPRRALGQPVPQAGQERVPALPADPRVAGPRGPGPPGGQGRRDQEHPRPGRAGGRPPGDPHRAALAPRRARRLAARLSRRPRRALRAVAGLGPEGQPELDHGQRAGRDLAAVGADGGARSTRAGSSPRPSTSCAAPTTSRAGTASGRRWWPSSGSRSTGCRSWPGAPCPTARSTRRSRATSSSGARWSRASGTRGTASWPPTRRWSRRCRSSRTARGGATSSSTTRRCTTSTRRGSRRASSPARTSTAGGATSGACGRTC